MNKKTISVEGRKIRPSNFLQKTIPFIILFVSGVLYYLSYTYLRIAIPCPLRTATGFILGREILCPGCGVTRMLVAEMHLDFKMAFMQNQAVFVLQPLIYFEILRSIIGHYKDSPVKYTRFENVMMIMMVVILVCFGIIRNVITLI